MEELDYTCVCQNTPNPKCNHVGDKYQKSSIVLELFLKDNKIYYTSAVYTGKGYATSTLNGVEYRFYLEEFKEHFEGIIKDYTPEERSKFFKQ